MMKKLEMVLMPGFIFTIWRPGRRVLPVVLMAPETKPSAFLSFTIMAAKNRGSFMVTAAFSGVTPFSLRIS